MPDTQLSLHDIFPNEVIRMFLASLSYKQLKGLQRVASIWNLLINTGLLSIAILKEEYGYLMTESEIEALEETERLRLIANQEKIYARLAEENSLLPEDLKKEHLEAYAAKDSHPFLTTKQQIFLREMCVATGIIADDDTLHNKGSIFSLIARIGNTQKLKEWSEKQGSRYLDKDFGTSKSPKSTRNARS